MNNVIHLIYADETSFKLCFTNLGRILRKGTGPHAGSNKIVDLGGMGDEMVIEKHFDVLGIIGVASGIDVLPRDASDDKQSNLKKSDYIIFSPPTETDNCWSQCEKNDY